MLCKGLSFKSSQDGPTTLVDGPMNIDVPRVKAIIKTWTQSIYVKDIFKILITTHDDIQYVNPPSKVIWFALRLVKKNTCR